MLLSSNFILVICFHIQFYLVQCSLFNCTLILSVFFSSMFNVLTKFSLSHFYLIYDSVFFLFKFYLFIFRCFFSQNLHQCFFTQTVPPDVLLLNVLNGTRSCVVLFCFTVSNIILKHIATIKITTTIIIDMTEYIKA